MLLLLATLLAMAPVVDSARTISGVALPATIEASGYTLSLNGAALRKKAIFKVYVAALYLTETSATPSDILAADQPRRMEMHFVRSVDKKKVCEAWEEGLEKNTPEASAALKQQFTELCGMMVNIKDGQSYSFTYIPGTGTTVVAAGEEKGVLPGKEFADAILRCWIGPKPGPGEGFKKDLLGAR